MDLSGLWEPTPGGPSGSEGSVKSEGRDERDKFSAGMWNVARSPRQQLALVSINVDFRLRLLALHIESVHSNIANGNSLHSYAPRRSLTRLRPFLGISIPRYHGT